MVQLSELLFMLKESYTKEFYDGNKTFKLTIGQLNGKTIVVIYQGDAAQGAYGAYVALDQQEVRRMINEQTEKGINEHFNL